MKWPKERLDECNNRRLPCPSPVKNTSQTGAKKRMRSTGCSDGLPIPQLCDCFCTANASPRNIRIHMDNTFYNCFHRGRQLQDGPSRPMAEAENQVSPVMLRRTGRSELLGFHVDDPDLEICCLWLRCYPELTGLARPRWPARFCSIWRALLWHPGTVAFCVAQCQTIKIQRDLSFPRHPAGSCFLPFRVA